MRLLELVKRFVLESFREETTTVPGLPELLIIGLIVIVIFGASRLPKLGKSLGEGIRNFKTGLGLGEKENSPTDDEGEQDDSSAD